MEQESYEEEVEENFDDGDYEEDMEFGIGEFDGSRWLPSDQDFTDALGF